MCPENLKPLPKDPDQLAAEIVRQSTEELEASKMRPSVGYVRAALLCVAVAVPHPEPVRKYWSKGGLPGNLTARIFPVAAIFRRRPFNNAMAPTASTRIHEIDFCAEVASYSNAIFSSHPEYPFKSARIEGFGRGADKANRKDIRIYDGTGRLILCGEVKLPGTTEGRSPYSEEFVRDAHQKADNAGVQFFFTWNVNLFVLWDRKKWDVPLLDRRVREWKLGLDLGSPDDAGRSDVLAHIQRGFLPDLFADLVDICTGRRPDWPMPADDVFIRSMESHLTNPSDS